MGKYRQHATSHSIAVTEEVFIYLKGGQAQLQRTSQDTITLDDVLRHFFNLIENKWSSTRFEKEV